MKKGRICSKILTGKPAKNVPLLGVEGRIILEETSKKQMFLCGIGLNSYRVSVYCRFSVIADRAPNTINFGVG